MKLEVYRFVRGFALVTVLFSFFPSGVLAKEFVKRVTIKNELEKSAQISAGSNTKSFPAVIVPARREREIKISVSNVAAANITIHAKGCNKTVFTTRWIIVKPSGKAGCEIDNVEGAGPNGEP
jgi:hypothetical protein